jgi:hypothetical protein
VKTNITKRLIEEEEMEEGGEYVPATKPFKGDWPQDIEEHLLWYANGQKVGEEPDVEWLEYERQ